jgi:hypothetical protein
MPLRSSVRPLLAGALIALLSSTALARDGDGVELQVMSGTPEHSVLTYTIPGHDADTIIIDGAPYLAVSLGEAGYHDMSAAGHPQLPALADSLLIPDDARMAVSVVSAEWHDVHGVDLAPWRGLIMRTQDPADVPYVFGPVYGEDALFPASIATLDEPYVLHDARGAVLRVVPFQYNSAQRLLRVYTQVQVEVTAVGPGEVNVIDRSAYGVRPDRTWWWLYGNQFANWSSYAVEPPPDNGDLLIIAQTQFLPTVQPLVDWKNATGIPTTLVDLATIGNDSDAIKAFINDVYEVSNLTFVLLVGDYPGLTSFWYAGGLSDPTYSTLTADWYPDLFVGRFSGTTTGHIATQVQRTIEYEQANHGVGAGGWNAMALGIASNEGAGIGHYGEGDWQHADNMRGELLSAGFTLVDQVYEPSASKAAIATALEAGRRYVNYTGHGSSTSWGTTGFGNNDVNALENVGALPIICSVACVNGEFDAGTCFAEAWLRATHAGQPAGAAATYMSSINQSWAPPMYAQGNHGYSSQYGANERLCLELCDTVSGLWFGGSCVMMDIVGNGGREMFMTWHVFGDPSLRSEATADESTLVASGSLMPADTPVDITFTVQPGVDFAGARYFLLATTSGTTPGFDLPNGLNVPINWDLITDYVVGNPNGVVFDGFFGTLDLEGVGQAHLDSTTLIPIDRSLIGTALDFAAIVWQAPGPYELVTNTKTVTIVD